MKVFVTGAGALLGQGIIKSLCLAETKYTIIAADPNPHAVGLYWADKAYLIPMADSEEYLERIWSILKAEKPEVILIGTDVELLIFAENKDFIENNTGSHVIVSPPQVIRIADDKWLTYKFLKENGFPYPQSVLADEADRLVQSCGFPLIVKPRRGARSAGVRTVRNEHELREALQATSEPIIQECVADAHHEYTSGVLTLGTEIRSVVTMRRDLRDGNTYRAYVLPGFEANDMLAEIAKRLRGFGPLNLQFRMDDGQPKVFEINARFSGTTPLRAYAGFNEVDFMIRYVVKGERIPPPKLSPKILLRYLDEIIIEPGSYEHLVYKKQGENLSFTKPGHHLSRGNNDDERI
ncbi:MAG TPA: ATP-grasp domain-containing protein [Caldithrix abyssi]|uniref:ATP-grasp domain-containing protein n=1 Tax=Caldithrix abyssi TaxID=187145 RepID=A0A7V4WWW7_CALAY|nr:ATP-grasp domain-containing protein [Caldithrix abyssi]